PHSLRGRTNKALRPPTAGTFVAHSTTLELAGNGQTSEPVSMNGDGFGSIPGFPTGAIRSLWGDNALGPVELGAGRATINVVAGSLQTGNLNGFGTGALGTIDK